MHLLRFGVGISRSKVSIKTKRRSRVERRKRLIRRRKRRSNRKRRASKCIIASWRVAISIWKHISRNTNSPIRKSL